MFFPSLRAQALAPFMVFAVPIALSPRAPVRAFNAPNVSLASPAGRWKTIDEATGKVKSIVGIREKNGKLYGTIEALFDPPVPHPTCYLCSGAMKDRPLVGLQILWGFHLDGSQWTGGQVLDPESGKIYRAALTLEDGGKELRLHGYIGIPLLGRTEHWLRAE
ncbi:MAG: DUF2147 domain-containing protein [Terracidiphilus sp.]